MTETTLKRLKFFSRFETHGFAGGDAYFFACPGIAADTRLARPDIKNSKSTQFDAIAFGKGFLHGVEYRLNGDFGFSFRDTGSVHYFVYDVMFNQADLLEKQ